MNDADQLAIALPQQRIGERLDAGQAHHRKGLPIRRLGFAVRVARVVTRCTVIRAFRLAFA